MTRLTCLALLLVLTVLATSLRAADRPNILWITAEDMSPTLGCYGDTYATTPHLDKLATQSVLFTHAFATSPVCSPSRSALINGVIASTQGTHNMRSAFPIPKEMTGFPSFMRKAGYYTTNNVKTDYNSANWKRIIEASWDESSDTAHWRKGPKGKPFFSVFNLMTSHQSRTMVWPYEKFQAEVQSKLSKDEIHDSAKAPLPPYYVDTPVVRKTVARYYDCVTAMDKEVGAILKQLEDDGHADNTIVFFFSDHGSGMPRHKRALLDSGMRVAMMVRVPAKWRHLFESKTSMKAKPGTKTDRLVSFDDFGPSVLSLSGVKIPDYMTGKPFAGPKAVEPREYVFGHRDRVDEVIDMARSVRGKRYLYIHNFMPHLGYNQPTAWPDLGEIRHEFYRLADPNQMTQAQWHFAGPTRPWLEVFDCVKDPLNLNNLAGKPEFKDVERRLGGQLMKHIANSRDLGFIPEAQMWELTNGQPPIVWAAGLKGWSRKNAERMFSALMGSQTPTDMLAPSLRDSDAVKRYWAAVGCSASTELQPEAAAALHESLADPSPNVRIESANALIRHGHPDKALPVLAKTLEHSNLAAVLHAARTIQLLGPKAKSLVPAMRATSARLDRLRPKDVPATVVQPGDLDMAMFIGFAIDAFLKEHGGDEEPSSGNSGGSAKPQAAWVDLFDGKTLNGWKAKKTGKGVEAKVVDGEIHLMSKGTNLWFAHERVLRDFELQAEALMPDGGYNSGLAFRGTSKGKFTGYQCEIAEAKSGSIYAIGKGWVWPKGKEQTDKFNRMAKGAFKTGQWNTFRVVCESNRIRIWVNGTLTADVESDLFAEGVIAIQHHGKGDVHRFRNIRVRPINDN